MDSIAYEEFMQCPFEASHRILKQRFAVHLVRCKRQHMDSDLMLCPFNATHFMNQKEMNDHVTFCPNRSSYESFKKSDPTTKQPQPLPPQPIMPNFSNSEDWSDDSEERYDPTAYADNAPVLRTMKGGSKKERAKFRKAERDRLLQIREMKK